MKTYIGCIYSKSQQVPIEKVTVRGTVPFATCSECQSRQHLNDLQQLMKEKSNGKSRVREWNTNLWFRTYFKMYQIEKELVHQKKETGRV